VREPARVLAPLLRGERAVHRRVGRALAADGRARRGRGLLAGGGRRRRRRRVALDRAAELTKVLQGVDVDCQVVVGRIGGRHVGQQRVVLCGQRWVEMLRGGARARERALARNRE
jgi:hypothetical protein